MSNMWSLFAGLLTGLSILAQSPASQSLRVTSNAIWGPGMSIMKGIREECSKGAPEQFGVCFVNMMQKSGASAEAVAFAQRTGNLGYVRDFKEAGPADIAFVHYPFRANEVQGAIIVNANPAWIDIDDQANLAQEELRNNQTYARLLRMFPDLTLWPGDRNGTTYLGVKRLPAGGVRLTAGYVLRKGCHACETAARVSFAFDFERSGRYLGCKLLGVSPQNR